MIGACLFAARTTRVLASIKRSRYPATDFGTRIGRSFCKEKPKVIGPESTPYEVLGVTFGCTDLEIKKAYVSLVKKYHPDLKSNTVEEDLQFELINQAYSTLRDPAKREEIDNNLKSKLRQYTQETNQESSSKDTSGGGSTKQESFRYSQQTSAAQDLHEQYLRQQIQNRYRRTRPVETPAPNKDALRQLWLNYTLYFSIVCFFIIGLFWVKVSINREGLLEVYDQSLGVRYYIDKERVDQQTKIEMQRYTERLRKQLDE